MLLVVVVLLNGQVGLPKRSPCKVDHSGRARHQRATRAVAVAAIRGLRFCPPLPSLV